MIDVGAFDLPWSRNYGDDIEEDDIQYDSLAAQPAEKVPDPVFSWSSTFAAPASSRYSMPLMVLANDERPVSFMRSVFGADQEHSRLELMATLAFPDLQSSAPLSTKSSSSSASSFSSSSSSTYSREGCFVYRVRPTQDQKAEDQAVIVLVQQEVPQERANALVEVLMNHLQPQRVVVLDCVLMGHYADPYASSASDVVPPLLRVIESSASKSSRPAPEESKSSKSKGKSKSQKKIVSFPAHPLCAYLEPPNVVNGLAAALMTHCQVYELPAEAFFSLESPHYVVETLSAFEAVLSHCQLPTQDFANKTGQEKKALYKEWSKLCARPSRTKGHIPAGVFA